MEINQGLISDISFDGGLKDRIEKLKVEFNQLGGSKKLNEIMKRTAEHEKKLEEIEN